MKFSTRLASSPYIRVYSAQSSGKLFFFRIRSFFLIRDRQIDRPEYIAPYYRLRLASLGVLPYADPQASTCFECVSYDTKRAHFQVTRIGLFMAVKIVSFVSQMSFIHLN